MSSPRPFRRLEDRELGIPLEETLVAGSPEWLMEPLGEWVAAVLSKPDPLARRVALSLRLAPTITFRSSCLAALEALEETVKTAAATAADHLLVAWKAAFGLSPDPDKAFNEAIRAVEEVACPLIEEKKAEAGRATLGTAIGQLKSAGRQWELVLPAQDDTAQNASSLAAMMETLWNAQRSRHGGGPNSRRQTVEEAEAAVHLAVLLVQWMSAGVVRRTPSP